MATQVYTTNLNLKKVTWVDAVPDTGTDFLLDFNENMDAVDALFAEKGHTRAPTTADDHDLGHYKGEPWCDTTNHILYIAESVDSDASIWRQVWPVDGSGLTGVNAALLNGHADTYFAVDADVLKKAGTVALTAAWDAGSWQIRAETFQSDVATGTAPLTVASTTVVANLHAANSDALNSLADTAFVKHSLADAENDFLVASGADVFVKKTLAETKTILGIVSGGGSSWLMGQVFS
jgi:hypothetical protein